MVAIRKQKVALVTVPWFIGFLSLKSFGRWLAGGGLDCLSDYYDVSLKESREVFF